MTAFVVGAPPALPRTGTCNVAMAGRKGRVLTGGWDAECTRREDGSFELNTVSSSRGWCGEEMSKEQWSVVSGCRCRCSSP